MVSVQQAAINAIVAYLSTQLPDVIFHKRWPTRDLPGPKVITLIPAGAARDTGFDPSVLSNTPIPNTNNTTSVWQVAERQQPVQLDVWCKSQSDRDDIIARLDKALRAGFAPIPSWVNNNPFENGFFVALQDGWEASNTTARCEFRNPDFFDNPDSVDRSLYRAVYAGDIWVKLTFEAVTPRQKTIGIKNVTDDDFDQTISNTP